MITFYKPNSKGTGHAISIGHKKDKFYISMLKQATVSQDKKGTFAASRKNPNKEIIVKLSTTEAGWIIACIEKNIKKTLIHTNPLKKATIAIEFSPYISQQDNKTQLGFGLKISQTPQADSKAPKISFLIGFDFGEARLLQQFLIYGLNKSFLSTPSQNNLDNSAQNTNNSVNGQNSAESSGSEGNESF